MTTYVYYLEGGIIVYTARPADFTHTNMIIIDKAAVILAINPNKAKVVEAIALYRDSIITSAIDPEGDWGHLLK